MVPSSSRASPGSGKTTAQTTFALSALRLAADDDVLAEPLVVWIVTLIGVGAAVNVIVGELQLIP